MNATQPKTLVFVQCVIIILHLGPIYMELFIALGIQTLFID